MALDGDVGRCGQFFRIDLERRQANERIVGADAELPCGGFGIALINVPGKARYVGIAIFGFIDLAGCGAEVRRGVRRGILGEAKGGFCFREGLGNRGVVGEVLVED